MIGCRWIDAHSLYLLSRRHIRNFGVDNSYCFAVVGDSGSVLFFLKSILHRLLNRIVRVCSQQFFWFVRFISSILARGIRNT